MVAQLTNSILAQEDDTFALLLSGAYTDPGA